MNHRHQIVSQQKRLVSWSLAFRRLYRCPNRLKPTLQRRALVPFMSDVAAWPSTTAAQTKLRLITLLMLFSGSLWWTTSASSALGQFQNYGQN
jgi:hypothetical protein